MVPDAFWMAGLRLLEWMNQSNFRNVLLPHLAAWQRLGWERIVESEHFQLVTPTRTVPQIQAVLDIGSDGGKFVAKLILETAPAVGSTLSQEYRNRLVAISTGEEHPPE